MTKVQSIKNFIKTNFLSDIIDIKISSCVHFCGFRYGLKEYNPYETYIMELHQNKPESSIQEKFINFLQHYRPSSFGEALGISLNRNYPLWQDPWDEKIDLDYNAHSMEHDMIPDIITHFSPDGIPYRIIKQEFRALRNAYESIKAEGYQPKKYGYAEVLCLQGDTSCAYILLDGNHRVSALSALGKTDVTVRLYRKNVIHKKKARQWYGVRKGIYEFDDAIKIFDVYFNGNKGYKISDFPAPIIY